MAENQAAKQMEADPGVGFIDVRIYFLRVDLDDMKGELLNNISDSLVESGQLSGMLGAHELVDDGDGHMVPAGEPIA